MHRTRTHAALMPHVGLARRALACLVSTAPTIPLGTLAALACTAMAKGHWCNTIYVHIYYRCKVSSWSILLYIGIRNSLHSFRISTAAMPAGSMVATTPKPSRTKDHHRLEDWQPNAPLSITWGQERWWHEVTRGYALWTGDTDQGAYEKPCSDLTVSHQVRLVQARLRWQESV
jgi:hypothetical protein